MTGIVVWISLIAYVVGMVGLFLYARHDRFRSVVSPNAEHDRDGLHEPALMGRR